MMRAQKKRIRKKIKKGEARERENLYNIGSMAPSLMIKKRPIKEQHYLQ